MRTDEDSIGEAKQKVLEAGPAGDRWYAVERADRVRPGAITRATFWGTDIALFRRSDGAVAAVEDRCAHRHLPFSEMGKVEGDRITCGYHGWQYDGAGRCVKIPLLPDQERGPCERVAIRAFPTGERYGLVWVFPGDPDEAEKTPLPAVERLDAGEPVAFTVLDEVFEAHHSMVIENFCDLYHEPLHDDYQPFHGSRLESATPTDDGFDFVYETDFARGLALKHFLDGFRPRMRVRLRYRYPHLSLDFEGRQELWLFLLPQAPARTRVLGFFLPRFLVPFTQRALPYGPSKALTRLFTALYASTFTRQDRVVLRCEQARAAEHGGKPSFEINPVIDPLRALLIRRWREYVARETARAGRAASRHQALVTLGGGLRFREVVGAR